MRALVTLLLLLAAPGRLPATTTAPEPAAGPCPADAPKLDAASRSPTPTAAPPAPGSKAR